MRAATRIGFISVGASRPAAHYQPQSNFKPRVIVADQAARREREATRSAIAHALAERTEFWSEELAAWVEDFPEAVEKLREELQIETDRSWRDG